MQLNIHGKSIEYDGKECGYYARQGFGSENYTKLDIPAFVGNLGGMPSEEARMLVESYRNIAGNQLAREALRIALPPLEARLSGRSQNNLNSQQQYLQNTQEVMEEILRALSN